MSGFNPTHTRVFGGDRFISSRDTPEMHTDTLEAGGAAKDVPPSSCYGSLTTSRVQSSC